MFNVSLETRINYLDSMKNHFSKFNSSFTYKNFSRSVDKANFLFLDEITPAQVINIVHRGQVEHVLQNSFQSYEDKFSILSLLSENYSAFFKDDFSFIKNPTHSFSITANITDQRHKLLELITTKLDISTESSRSLPFIKSAEELIMNVQLNEAHQKNPKKGHFHIFAEKNDQLASIAVKDFYGDLKIDKLLSKIESSMSIGMNNSINFGRGGAGLGTSIIYESADSFYVGLRPGSETKVAVTIPINISEKKLLSIQKSFHIIKGS